MDSTVYVGNKGVMNYVLAVITQFNTENAKEVRIKARGKAISRAVDVEEMVRNRFLPEVKVKEINLGTDKVQNDDGKSVNISTIEIVLEK
ncbi:MAG: archaea-specific DNA-binding protein [Methanothermococcus sp.]|jgi:DNA-binding protein|uniref:DNA/RNA-binding protein Alba n=1 Tax=Methanothermococcus thermolithotrophicus TaxID=2186 RepID=A5JSW7_METTL|nr:MULTISPECIES: DNA-binding protein Alba [Methanothermococcus]ABQ42618.1 DNA-binding protein Alba [Methanothermococcus thermolithotrophicus]MDK2790469.1 archaea-specific DNA-binding protein [Methanothermococcus sp.]MDK2987609.1 archaea-specific DNA-binding protein [Methanothermococcus sp.]